MSNDFNHQQVLFIDTRSRRDQNRSVAIHHRSKNRVHVCKKAFKESEGKTVVPAGGGGGAPSAVTTAMRLDIQMTADTASFSNLNEPS